MKSTILKIGLLALFVVIYSCSNETEMKKESVYNVARLKEPMKIDAHMGQAAVEKYSSC